MAVDTTARNVNVSNPRSYPTRGGERRNCTDCIENIFGGIQTIYIFALSVRLDRGSIYSGLI
jgi:hypothetical protein